jgi:hypothetical protein
MIDFRKLEQDALAAVKNVISDAEAHEPALEDAVVEALGAAGAPGAVAAAFGGLLSALVAHFQSQPQGIEHPADGSMSPTVENPASVATTSAAWEAPASPAST